MQRHMLCSITFFNLAVYKMSKNIVQPCRRQTTTWRMRITCLILKTTSTNSGYVIFNRFSTATVVKRTRLNVTIYHIACLVSNARRKIVTRFLYVFARVKSSFGQNLMFIFQKGPLKSKIVGVINFVA
jgi:hypothetical protein